MTVALPGASENVALPRDPVVRLDGLHLTLGGPGGMVNVLQGIDLEIAPTETVAVVGPSGSGKTSLLMVVAGLERPTQGTVHVAGANLGSLDESGLALFRRRSVGIVFQAFHLIPTMNALENVAVPMEIAGRSDAFAAARQWLGEVGLGHRLTHYPGQLSGGEQQRVALARALAVEPKLLLADEPTGNLDGETGRHVVELLFGLTRRIGGSLMLITHDRDLASRCDRRVHLANGRVVDAEPLSTLRAAGGHR